MSPRDRKRDRVLKRRRETKKKDRGNEGDNDDSLERMYLASRKERVAKKPKVIEAINNDPPSDEVEAKRSVFQVPSCDASAQAEQNAPDESTSAPLTKEERQRIKNQQRKALRREKKAKKQEMAEKIELQKQKEQAEVERLALKQKQVKKKAQDKASSQDFQSMRLGVQYKDITIGKGPEVQDRKKVRVSYKLRAGHRYGKLIDSSGDFRFRVGKGEVVKGWDIGLMGMRQGGVRYLIVPPEAGYGRRNVGAGSGGLLFFEITLISC